MIGSTLEGRYEVVAKIGEGGMGVVYRGHDPLLKRDVAIKMVPPARLDAKNEARFRREARLVAQMDHRSIVPIHDLGEHQGSLFIVMPLVDGVTLRQRIDARDLSPEEAIKIAIEVAEALAHSHARGVIHRDVKPENIMVSEDGGELRVRVMDFGLAWDSDEQMSHSGAVGTPAYLSPEQLKSEELDERTDLYALGTTLYECLSGRPPFEGPIHSMIYRIGHEPPPPLALGDRPAEEELQAIVLGCLAKRPKDRPASAVLLASQLRDYLQASAGGDAPALAPPQGPGRASRVRRSGSLARTSPEDALPMVGRQEVWTALKQRLDAALGGECQMAFLGGDAGMGKTRTLRELESLARAEGILVLRGRYSDVEESFPYEGLCDLVRDYFRPGGAWSQAREPGGPAPELGDLAGELLRLFPIFSEVPELRRIAEVTQEDAERARVLLDDGSETEKTYVFELLARTLIRLSDGRPLMLLLENLHSAFASIEALRYIIYRLGPTPTLLVGSYRPGQVDRAHPLRRLMQSFASDARSRFLRLKPLTAAEVKRMAELVAGEGELEAELAERLYEATEGNPLFVQELVRSLCESGSMTRGEGKRWRLSAETTLSSQTLPATIQQVIEARLERLPEDLRRVLTYGAVFGPGFDYADLEELYEGTSEELDAAVERLVVEGILREDRESRGDRLDFTSRLVRDLLYQSLPRRRRRALHRHCAERLEARSTGHEERIYPLLVYHYSAGDVPDKTVTYALKQARRALQAASADDAIRAAKTALEFVEEEEVEDSRHLAGELFEILARAHRTLGQYGRSLQNAARAAVAFAEDGEPDRETRASLLAAQAAWQGRQIEATRLWVDRGVEAGRGKAANEDLHRLLALGSTVANLRGETLLAKLYREEAEHLEPKMDAEQAPQESMPRGGTLRAALPLGLGKMDPAELVSDEHGEVLTMVFETLLGVDDEGHLVPALCNDWEEAEDGRLFRLRLRPGIRFADGHPLSARDVKASFERLAKIRVDSPIPALAWVEGREAFVRGKAEEIRGLKTASDEPPLELFIRLSEPLPIYPSLLTDPYTAVVRVPQEGSGLVGTGPFQLARRDFESVLLRGNAGHWRGAPPYLDAVEFLTAISSSDVLAGLRDGSLDLGRGLAGDDLEAVLRDPILGPGLVETTQRNVHFLLFNTRGPLSRHAGLRQALLGVVRTSDLVWRTLGRFAQPASSLIPPGLLGHDPGHRRATLTPNESREILKATGLKLPVRLVAVIHPVLLERGIELVRALLAEFSALGVEVDFEPRPMASYIQAYERPDAIDLLIGRWNADYGDPDTFTHSLFDSRHGLLRRYFSSPEADRCLARGRQEASASARQSSYLDFQQILERDHVLLPLFHDVSYRIAGPQVRGLRLRNTLPYVNYTTLGKQEAAGMPAAPARPWIGGGGELHAAVHSRLASLDPASGNFTDQVEVISNVFECLTRLDDEARVVPWLAESLEAEAAARRFRFRLRPDVRFQDGRRLSARDVRYSFERLLRSPERSMHFLLLPIRGAEALRQGEAQELAGLQIVSAGELVIELEEPLVFFPALLAHPGAAILPEGLETFEGDGRSVDWRQGCVGTGPFRVVRFEPGSVLELERNSGYWRRGFPRSERLIFHLGVSPESMLEELRAGRLSVASGLSPNDVAALRRDPEFADVYREAPRLSTLFLALNAHRGPLADPAVRRSLRDRLALDELIHGTVGHQGVRARSLIPPGLLGYEEQRREEPAAATEEPLPSLGLQAAWIHAFEGQYGALGKGFQKSFQELGIELRIVTANPLEAERLSRDGSVDATFYRWVADYPDPDSFVTSLLDSKEGVVSGLVANSEVDRLAERGRRETDPALRHAVYREIEEILEREALVVPLFHEQNCHFSHPTVEGLRIAFSLPEIPYDELSLRR